MAQKITDTLVRKLETPAKGNRITYDEDVKGFGVRITAAGAKSFVYNYRIKGNGRERRKTIGTYPAWSVAAARDEAKDLTREVDRGGDPMGDLHAQRDAPIVGDLVTYYREHHLLGKAEKSQRNDNDMIDKYVLPALGKLKVADVQHSDIAKLHRDVSKKRQPKREAATKEGGTTKKAKGKSKKGKGRPTGGPVVANRVVALLSKMFSIAMHPDLAWRTTNPATGIKHNPEDERERYLSPDELERLTEALQAYADQKIANAVRLILLTGARKSEVLHATWDQFDLERGTWTKQSHDTKQKRKHVVPLSAPAMALLCDIQAESECKFVFPSDQTAEKPVQDIKSAWQTIRKNAKLKDFRIHDLRHTYASILVSSNVSLPIIGKLLGHTRAETTRRYAHLRDDVLRSATDRVGSVVSSVGKPAAEVVELPRKRGA